MNIRQKTEKLLGEKVVSEESLGGGCIADAIKIKTESGNSYFVKSYGGKSDILGNEANGLIELAKPGVIDIPKVIAFNSDVLILTFIEQGRKAPNFYEDFGRKFALMHKYHGEKFGFFEDNYIGASQQKNLPNSTDWTEFYWENRLLYQVKLAFRNGYADSEFKKLVGNIESNIHKIIPDDGEKPSLLHGDLWGGNYLVSKEGKAVLIDPAVYYGHREADLAMTKIFGGFTNEFYSAYQEEFPLSYGWREREPIYKLYHILNHLNLFGYGYYSQAISLMKMY